MSRFRYAAVTRVLAGLRDALLPCACLGCGRPIGDDRPLLGLCVPCRGRLCRCEGRCAGCARPIAGASLPPGFLCGNCRHARPAYDSLEALYLYRPPLEAVVRHLKFGGLWYLGRQIAAVIADHLGTRLQPADLIVPVPLHWRRQLRRGYNQAEEIARPLARLLGKPIARPLVRMRHTVAQATLPRRARWTNLDGAFRLRKRPRIDRLGILLIDDVATTGKTLDAAAKVLKRGGAARVTAAILARADLERSSNALPGKVLETSSGNGSCERLAASRDAALGAGDRTAAPRRAD